MEMMSIKSILNESVMRFTLKLKCSANVGSSQQGSLLGLVQGVLNDKIAKQMRIQTAIAIDK